MAETNLATTKPSKRTDLAYMWGEYIPPTDSQDDAYVAYCKHCDTGEIIQKVVEAPECTIWITKPEYRTFTHKKEWASKKELDEYQVRWKDRAEFIWNILNADPMRPRWRSMRYVRLKDQLSSPFVFGADIDLGVRMKYKLLKMSGGRKPVNFNVGHLDIETDVNGTNQIILITFMNGNGDTYVSILREFFKDHTPDEVEKMWREEVEPNFRAALNEDGLKAYTNSEPIKLHLKILDDEVSLIKWTFANIHQCRPDFMTIWNMDYDIPYIIERCQFRQLDPADIFCAPDLPKKFRMCKYHLDKGKKGGHMTDRWSVFHLTDYTKYIDAMCSYGRIRKAKPKEASYRLDAIGGKELGTGKLSFGDGNDHYTMQLHHQVEYTVYNIVDVLILRCLELKNHDMRTMLMLTGDSLIDDFAHQSVQLKNTFYVHLNEENRNGVPSAMGNKIDNPWDKYIFNKGGAVLSPDRCKGTGVSILLETDNESYVHKYVCDEDFKAYYPWLMSMLNCTRETKLATLLHIIPAKDNKRLLKPVPVTVEQIDAIPEVAAALEIYNDESLTEDEREEAMSFMSERLQQYLYAAIYPESNSVDLCSKWHGLPDYEEMGRLVARELQEESLMRVTT